MKKKGQAILICMLLCLCCLLGGCRESVLQTVHTSACELAANGEWCSAQMMGTPYITVEITEELTEILNPSCWKRTLFGSTDTPYCYIVLTSAKLEFYEDDWLRVTVTDTNDQKWYVSKAEVRSQMKRYMEQYGGLLPEIPEYVAVCT